MAHQLHTKSLPSLHAFTMKTPYQIKTLIQACISRQVCRHVVRAIAYAKSLVLDLFNARDDTKNYTVKLKNRKKSRKKIIDSIRMCFTRPSSHVIPMMEHHEYYDSTWHSVINVTNEGDDDMKDYLQWLEEEKDGNKDGDVTDDASESIDRLAEKFIEMCHEKFRLEKQESYRRYQEMLARSL